MLLTLGDVAVHGVDDNGDLGAGHGGCFGGSSSYWGSCSCFGSRVCTEPGKCTVYVIRAQSDDIGDILRNSQETGDGPNSNNCPTFALSHVWSNSFRKPPNSKRVHLESFSSILDRHVKYRSYIRPDTSHSKQLLPNR